MYDLIMIRYGEIGTKGKNKKQFIACLYNNIKTVLKEFSSVRVVNHYERIYVHLNGCDQKRIFTLLNKIPGIASYSPVYFLKQDLDQVSKKALEMLKDIKVNTFKVETRRADKNFFPNSMDVSRIIGGKILKSSNLKVDVHNPQLLIQLEIREEGIYLFYEKNKGLGGYPLGMGGKAMLLLSGGIDSPVAAVEMMKRGVKLEAIHFASPPYTSDLSVEKVKDIVKKLNLYQPEIKIHLVNFTKIQEAIYANASESYAITLMRRMMLKIASRYAKATKCSALVTGESIGQVASQTLESILVINEVTCFPILRPLATLDKMEVVEKAKEIGTYEISILPYEDCCTIFTPKNPITKPTIKKALYYESSFDYEPLLLQALNSIEVLEINKDENEIF